MTSSTVCMGMSAYVLASVFSALYAGMTTAIFGRARLSVIQIPLRVRMTGNVRSRIARSFRSTDAC